MPTKNQHGGSHASGDDVILRWTVHLARDYPTKLLVSIIMIVAAASVAVYTIGPAGGVATILVMLSALADFLFPVTYILNSEGAEARMLLKKAVISWSSVKCCYLDDHGAKLSPLDKPTRLEAFRGVYLRFKDNDEHVIDVIRSIREKQ